MPKIINVYLSGPMYLGKEQAFGWREEITKRLNDWMREPENGQIVQFHILDPCRRWYDSKSELHHFGRYVVHVDKAEIAKSHVVIVNANDPGWGTPMEQYIAFTSGKLVIAFSDCEYPSIWAIAHSHMMLKYDWEAARFVCTMAKELTEAV